MFTKLIFSNALYISYIIYCVILELSKTDYKTFVTWLKTFSKGFTNSFILLNYINKTLVLLFHCRIIKPNSHLLNWLLDKINYIEEAEYFFFKCYNKLKNRRISNHKNCSYKKR